MTSELVLAAAHAGYGPIEVLHGVDLSLPRGTVTALLGPNGAGKSTALGVLAGTVPLRSGALHWAGVDASRLTVHQRAAAGLMLIPEKRGIFFGLTVRENLDVFAGATTSAGLEPALDVFPVLGRRLGQQAGSLSGGEQQMLAMSRALLHRPRVLLLDEISSGLAPRVVASLLDVVARLAEEQIAVVLVEQYLATALAMAGIVYVLARGKVVFAGEPGELVGRRLPGYAVG